MSTYPPLVSLSLFLNFNANLKFEKFVNSKKIQWILGILAAAAIGSFVIRALVKIQSGHGLDYYISRSGAKLNYIGAIVSICTVVPILLIGWLFSKSQRNDTRSGLNT